MQLGKRISEKRKEIGMTQAELADKMHVTRQTVSRWEAGTVYPDIEKVVELANVLETSCDYLLKGDEIAKEASIVTSNQITRLFTNLIDKFVKFTFYDDAEDYELFDKKCLVRGFEGNWVQVDVILPKGSMQKLIAISSILSVEILSEE